MIEFKLNEDQFNAIKEKLDEIRCGLIDIESVAENKPWVKAFPQLCVRGCVVDKSPPGCPIQNDGLACDSGAVMFFECRKLQGE